MTGKFDRRIGPDDKRTAQELADGLYERLGGWGKSLVFGSYGCLTPKAMLVLALRAASSPTITYRDKSGVPHTETGLVWTIDGDEITMMIPSNSPGARRVRFTIDAVEAVAVTPDDRLVKRSVLYDAEPPVEWQEIPVSEVREGDVIDIDGVHRVVTRKPRSRQSDDTTLLRYASAGEDREVRLDTTGMVRLYERGT